jgi:hypothetical protein
MSEARQLEPDVGLGAPANKAPAVTPSATEADLAPLLIEQSATLTGDSKPLADKRRATREELAEALADQPELPGRTPFLDRFSNMMMVLFVSGLFSFLLGIAAAAAVVLGLLDLQTGWVKDLLKTLKELAKSFAGPGGGGAPEP